MANTILFHSLPTSFLEFGKLAQGFACQPHFFQLIELRTIGALDADNYTITRVFLQRLFKLQRLLAPGVAFFKQQACGAISVTLITWKWTVIMAGINLSFQPL